MNDLSPETRALLDRARGGDALPRGHRRVLRRRLAAAAGVVAPLSVSTTAAAMWAARGLAILAATGIVHAAVVAPVFSRATPVAQPVVVRTARPTAPVVVKTARPTAPIELAPPEPPEPAPPVPPEPAPPATAKPARTARPTPPVAVVGPTPVANPAPTPMSTLRGESPLAAELRLVGDAQHALRAGDAERSLALLGEHDQRFPSGALAPEAAALRVDALCAAGRASDAESARQHFEVQYPGSPLARALGSGCMRGAAR